MSQRHFLEKQDRKEITIRNKQDENNKIHYKRDRYNVVHPRWAMSTHKFPVLYYYTIQQNEGIQCVA